MKKYHIFISNLSKEALQNGLITKHISAMYDALETALINNYEDYFESLFSLFVPLFNEIKDANLDSLLLNINDNYLTSLVDRTVELYNLFTDKWPNIDSKNLPNYEPLKIMKNAEKIIENNKNIDLKAIYISIYSMYKNLIIEQNIESKKILTGCLFDIWKIDIEFAYEKIQEFLEVVISSFNYEVFCFRNSGQNPLLLEKLWTQLIESDTTASLEKRTKKFIAEKIYLTTAFRPLWFKLLYNKYKDLNLLNKVLIEALCSKEIEIVLKDRDNLTKLILKEFNEDKIKNTLALTLFTAYMRVSDGTNKRSLALWIKDLIGVNASNIINAKTLKKSPDYQNDVKKLSKIFTGNIALTRMVNQLNKKNKK